ncbi:hypothetical protein [Streptomyces sp. NPDC052727]|uniref:hypothetical protein n=1 Tax=unclassified Streptomyces TaxID=2593676 RepID=UPI0034189194
MTRERHIRSGRLPPRRVCRREHFECLDVDGEAVGIKLGTFLDNTHRRADKLTPERRAEFDRLGVRW